MKAIIIFLTAVLYSSFGFAQDTAISAAELKELRKNPDTSRTVYITEEDRTGGPKVSEEESLGTRNSRSDGLASQHSTNDTVSTGVVEKTSEEEPVNGGVLTDLNFTPSSVQNSESSSRAKYSSTFLDTHALALAANCTPLSAKGEKRTAVVPIDDMFFVIPTKPEDLPPYPENGGTLGMHGVDVNQNCVRDDIEHYVFNKYPKADQERLRLNLYSHAIWLNFFLIDNISDKTVQGIDRQNIKTGKCMDILLGMASGRLARGDLFAHVHNTMERSERYFENMEVLRGFLIDEDVSGTCL